MCTSGKIHLQKHQSLLVLFLSPMLSWWMCHQSPKYAAGHGGIWVQLMSVSQIWTHMVSLPTVLHEHSAPSIYAL
jgi:hypothetical protein